MYNNTRYQEAMPQELGLDEALVTVNKSHIEQPVDIYSQLVECYGCPLERFGSLEVDSSDFVISSKHQLKLEFRASNSSVLCRLDSVDLNSHGHYKIELANSVGSPCNIRELDSGDCMLCPVALLMCLIIMVSLGEKLYSKFIGCREQRDKLESENSSTRGDGQPNESTIPDLTLPTEIIPLEPSNKPDRLLVLDAFRGLTITGMIMVNYGGAGYSALEHVPWDGISLADFVFPFFVFATGVSVSFSSRIVVGRDRSLKDCLLGVLRRTVVLFLIGICLNSTKLGAEGKLDNLRLTGVLQRLAVSYLVVASTYIIEIKLVQRLSRSSSTYRANLVPKLVGALLELVVATIMLSVYLFVTFQLQYSDTCPAGYVGPGGLTEGGRYRDCTGGAAGWLDKLVLADSHLYQDLELKHIFKTQMTQDPEGILGFTTSILLTLFGLQCGKILTQFSQHQRRLVQMLAGCGFLGLCSIAVITIPINKRLWSLTFVTVTGSSGFAVMALLYLITDVYKWRQVFLLRLLVSAGRNSIFLYVAHSLIHYMLPWYFSVDNTSHLQLLLLLAWSTFLWLMVAHQMAREQIFISV